MSDPDIDQLLAQLRDEPAPFPSVRERVLTHVARERRRRGLVFRACAAIAAAAEAVFRNSRRLTLNPPIELSLFESIFII